MRPIRLAVLVAPALLAALLLAPSTRAQPPVAFDPPTYLSAGNSPVSVATGDFNADDDPDLAVANRFSSTVSVLLGGAAGGFTGPTSFPTGFFSTSVVVGHFNADQDPDLAVANAGDGTVSVLLGGPGGGSAVPPTSPPTALSRTQTQTISASLQRAACQKSWQKISASHARTGSPWLDPHRLGVTERLGATMPPR
jgi:hypothetical protein